jgi:hypothetical protein
VVVRELGGDGLAEDQAARALEERDAAGVRLRPVAAVDRRVVLRRQAGGVDDVLEADRHAVQRSAPGRAVERVRLRERALAVDERPGAHLLVALVDAFQARRGERFGRDLALLDAPRRLGGAKLVQLLCHGGQA